MAKVETKVSILEVLSNAIDLMRPSDIGETIGESALNTGRYLNELALSGLVQKPDKKKSLYEITDKGRDYLENPPEESKSEELKESTERKHREEAQRGSTEDTIEEPTETVPSQSDLFRGIGERLGVGTRKGDVRLDAIIYYVQRTADLDNLSLVWNALTEMGVANDVKKRWVKLYAQNIPGKEIPEELKEKLESGLEPDKVRAETGEIAPKPKRFSVAGGEIIGDPEGDLNFKEALQLLAQQKGVPAAQADPLVAMVEAMKLGPEMATNTLTAMIPLITDKGTPPQPDNTLNTFLQQQTQLQQQQTQLMQQRMEQLAEDKHKAEMESLRAEIRGGQRPPEADQRLEALTTQIETLRESLHQQQMDRIVEQQQRTAEQLQDKIGRLEQQIAAASQSGRIESRYGLMDKGATIADTQLSGVRQDAKEIAHMIVDMGKPGPRIKTPEERIKIVKGLKGAVELENRARQLEDKLLFGNPQK